MLWYRLASQWHGVVGVVWVGHRVLLCEEHGRQCSIAGINIGADQTELCSKLIGTVRLRQLRVRDDECNMLVRFASLVTSNYTVFSGWFQW